MTEHHATYLPRRSDWLLLASGSAFKFSLVGFYMIAVMTMLKTQGYSLNQLSWVYLLGAAEVSKVLFSTLIERYRLPRFGRFRFWMLSACAGIAVTLALLMLIHPQNHFAWLLPLCLLLSVMSVLFGCAILGLSCVLLPYRERGFGGVIQVVAARIGKMLGGGLVLWVYQHNGWRPAIAIVLTAAILMLIQLSVYREPAHSNMDNNPPACFQTLFRRMADFWRQRGNGRNWLLLLLFCCTPYALVAATFVPKLNDLGWSAQDIGQILAIIVPVACIIMTPLSGWLMRHYPRHRLMNILLGWQVPVLALFLVIDRLSGIHPWLSAAPVILLSLGYTLLLPVILTLIMDKSAQEFAALDSALQFTVVLAGTYSAGFLSLRLAAQAGYSATYAAATATGLLLWLGCLAAAYLFQPSEHEKAV